jgi:hypothetical protein
MTKSIQNNNYNTRSVELNFVSFFFYNKLDTLLLKQKNLPVLDITGFFFRIRTQVTALVLLPTSAFTSVLMLKKKPNISNTGRFFCFNSTVSYTYMVGKLRCQDSIFINY